MNVERVSERLATFNVIYELIHRKSPLAAIFAGVSSMTVVI